MTAEYTWADDGLVVHRDFLDRDLIDAYLHVRGTAARRWDFPTPYMLEPTLRDLCCSSDVTCLLTDLLGEEPVLHLNLTGFRSTQRAWHQDGYLNPPGVGDFYVAVWMALDTIDVDSGPFEFIPGSHLWDCRLSHDDALAMGTAEQRRHPDWHRMWPSWTQDRVAAYWQAEIDRRPVTVEPFWPAERGDLLVWSPWLVHRGSTPRRPDVTRPALIAHYSGANHRDDMPQRKRHNHGGLYAVLPTDGVCS